MAFARLNVPRVSGVFHWQLPLALIATSTALLGLRIAEPWTRAAVFAESGVA